jgi:hypothetical protein
MNAFDAASLLRSLPKERRVVQLSGAISSIRSTTVAEAFACAGHVRRLFNARPLAACVVVTGVQRVAA